MMRAVRFFIKDARKYEAFCPCGCSFVGRSRRAYKASRKGHKTVFKSRHGNSTDRVDKYAQQIV